MEHKKLIQFIAAIIGLAMITMFISMSNTISYPFNIYLMIGVCVVMLLLVMKLIYDVFTADPLVPVHYNDHPGRKIFFISPYRSTTLSVVMIVFPLFFFYLFAQLFPVFMKDIQTESVIKVITIAIFSVIILCAALYCLFEGIKLFIRRKKIIQLIIDDDSFEFLPIYDFGSTTRNTNTLSMFFRKEMKKAYFTDQLRIEMVKDKWQGNKIRMYVEGVRFYLPYLYNDTNELEEVYQTLQQRLQKANSL
ncbi:hypothetical protein N6B72_03120 [Chryseobacterium soli]|uniref:hypothetical protein n=1 Tax=Chryseobacterium soli TaxID=445961 RepID=UPI002953AEF0|nr:hypothetical protein [Chryseobacterium soli]MDV7695902.1 hypothetical protein [Chryseobacterium soli]